MPSHSETQILPYSVRQLFDLVADVERYPQFLPWCTAARILERKENEFLGELVIRFGPMSERYTSRVSLHPPAGDHAPAAIEVDLVHGPFSHLDNHWRFTPLPDHHTQIDFTLDFQFHSKLLETMLGGMFTAATQKMMGAFRARAELLYGKNNAAVLS